MKKKVTLILGLLIALCLVGCSKEENSPAENVVNSIVGIWEQAWGNANNRRERMNFSDDGICVHYFVDENGDKDAVTAAEYFFEGDDLTIFDENDEEKYKFSVDEECLTIYIEDMVAIYKRVG